MYLHAVGFVMLFFQFHILPSLQLARQGNVFATDTILTSLMCCTRSVNPWDIVVQKVKNKIFLDKRDDSDFGMYVLVC